MESLASYTPNMYDVNPTRSRTAGVTSAVTSYASGPTAVGASNIPVCGYDKLSLYGEAATWSYCFKYADGTTSETQTFAKNAWTDWISIPANAIAVICWQYSNNNYVYYSLLTKDSPYNPDNQ